MRPACGASRRHIGQRRSLPLTLPWLRELGHRPGRMGRVLLRNDGERDIQQHAGLPCVADRVGDGSLVAALGGSAGMPDGNREGAVVGKRWRGEQLAQPLKYRMRPLLASRVQDDGHRVAWVQLQCIRVTDMWTDALGQRGQRIAGVPPVTLLRSRLALKRTEDQKGAVLALPETGMSMPVQTFRQLFAAAPML